VTDSYWQWRRLFLTSLTSDRSY